MRELNDASPRHRRVVIVLLVMAVQFGVFEAALRVWGSSEAAPAFQGLFIRDPDVGSRLKPGARIRFTTVEFDTEIAVNNVGVRDDEDLGPKSPGERRIVILGDSLVLSVQVPQRITFAEGLERRLNARSGSSRYRVINAGVQGYGPVQEWLFFRKLAATLEPDLVIVTIFVGNDAEEAFSSRAALNPSERPATERLAESLTTRLRRLVRNSMVLQVLRTRVLAVTNRLRVGVAPPEPPLQTYAARPAPRIQEGIEITRATIRDIARHAATVGARTAVLLMPARFQLVDEDYEHLRRAVVESGGELVRDAASTRFAAAVADLGLPWLDVLPMLRQAPQARELFFERNIHLTPRGHEIVAAALDEFLARHQLVDAADAAGRSR